LFQCLPHFIEEQSKVNVFRLNTLGILVHV
jgi:hypothetical protein